MTNFKLRLHTKNLIVSKIQFLKFFLFIYFQFGYYFVSKILRRVTWIEKEVKNFIFVFLWNFIYFLNIFSINVWEQNFKLLIKMIFFVCRKLICLVTTITKRLQSLPLVTLSTLGFNQFGCLICLFLSNRLLSIYLIVFLMSFLLFFLCVYLSYNLFYPRLSFVISLLYLAPSLYYLCLVIILSLCL
jgi:hypothetical protein